LRDGGGREIACRLSFSEGDGTKYQKSTALLWLLSSDLNQ
jgi:hypothetical protein